MLVYYFGFGSLGVDACLGGRWALILLAEAYKARWIIFQSLKTT